MPTRLALLATLLSLAACGEADTSPIRISAIGGAPRLSNPNLVALDPPSALLVEAAAQGLVSLDAAGQIEPGLAQRWIVSDDGLRYTFRLRRAEWAGGGRVLARQVAERLRAASSGASRNPLKPLLGAIARIEAMTDEVLEITLAAPRPNLLQLLAQPQMAILRAGHGAGPYAASPDGSGRILLRLPYDADDAEEGRPPPIAIRLRGDSATRAVAQFEAGEAELVVGGTAGDLPIARAADPGDALRFDPAAGLFGLAFTARFDGDADLRAALAMAIDRAALVAALDVPGLLPRETLLPGGISEQPLPARPGWAGADIAARRAAAARIVAAAGDAPQLRVAISDSPGHRLIFAHLRRDWRAIGVEAVQVRTARDADLRLIDAVAPAELASWYLRNFTCDAAPVCDRDADAALAAARAAPTPAERRAALAEADRLLSEAVPFIALAAPVRWSLVASRLTGFRPNIFARHNVAELIAPGRRRP